MIEETCRERQNTSHEVIAKLPSIEKYTNLLLKLQCRIFLARISVNNESTSEDALFYLQNSICYNNNKTEFSATCPRKFLVSQVLCVKV